MPEMAEKLCDYDPADALKSDEAIEMSSKPAMPDTLQRH
jgi:hypothetical protein